MAMGRSFAMNYALTRYYDHLAFLKSDPKQPNKQKNKNKNEN